MNATNLASPARRRSPPRRRRSTGTRFALSKSIAAVYGRKAGNDFLNGKFQWRDHVQFFVDYTVAKAKNDRAALPNLRHRPGRL
jgi:hypothetical protein